MRGNPSAWPRPGSVCLRPREQHKRRSLSRIVWDGVPRPSNQRYKRRSSLKGWSPEEEITRGDPSAWQRPGPVCRRPRKTTQGEIPQQDNLGRCASAE